MPLVLMEMNTTTCLTSRDYDCFSTVLNDRLLADEFCNTTRGSFVFFTKATVTVHDINQNANEPLEIN
jgi:hypothetical protein